MGWTNKVPYRHPHSYCHKPAFKKDFDVGSVWKCDDCQRLWKVTKIDYGDQRDGPYAVWELYEPPMNGWRD